MYTDIFYTSKSKEENHFDVFLYILDYILLFGYSITFLQNQTITMPLESIHNRTNIETSPLKTTKIQNKQRIISESTGLVKFSITSQTINDKITQFEGLNDQFAELELKMDITSPKKVIRKTKSGLNLPSSTYATYSPQRSPINTNRRQEPVGKDNIIMESNGDMLLELASKQREVLEYKTQINLLKSKLQISERQLYDLEKKCNSSLLSNSLSTRPYYPPTDNNKLGSLRTRNSIQQLRSTIETTATTHQQNFSNLVKKKLSISQLNNSNNSNSNNNDNNNSNSLSSVNLNQNFTKFQRDTNQLLEKGLCFVNNLKKEFKAKQQRPIYSQSDYIRDFNSSQINYTDDESDTNSDYGSADISDYHIAIK